MLKLGSESRQQSGTLGDNLTRSLETVAVQRLFAVKKELI